VLELTDISKTVSGEILARNVSLCLEAGTTNILLGPTLAGKTSLMRLMAGLDNPDSGSLRFNGQSVLGVPVQQRKIAMVYQQFINYPSLSVFENIASPLRVARLRDADIRRRVGEAASLLKISDYLQRLPAELSGGQQQRVALARALVKEAELVLLDEPLANLDYKLREELRAELPTLFQAKGAVLVYATTEPLEALMLGGHTAVLHEGSVAQFGATADLFRYPRNLVSARAFSDPPLNTASVSISDNTLALVGYETLLRTPAPALAEGRYTIGLRPHEVRLGRRGPDDIELSVQVVVNEITGSESFIHFNLAEQSWVALVHGVQDIAPGAVISCYLDPSEFYYFYPGGELALLPQSVGVA
jgi:glycerol transport system ATP-binding protein